MIINMMNAGELSEETVKQVEKLWLRNPADERMVVKQPRKPKPVAPSAYFLLVCYRRLDE